MTDHPVLNRFHQSIPIHTAMLDRPGVEHRLRLICPAESSERGISVTHCCAPQDVQAMVFGQSQHSRTKPSRNGRDAHRRVYQNAVCPLPSLQDDSAPYNSTGVASSVTLISRSGR